MLVEEPLPPVVSGLGVESSGLAEVAPSAMIAAAITIDPPPPPASVQPDRIEVGGQVVAAKLIHQPHPVYPPLARQARIQGTVQLRAVIGREGGIQSLAVISGHPVLVQAALDAVRQWRYQPTLLNGLPVEVETTIDVKFALGR
jgi:protein TonB